MQKNTPAIIAELQKDAAKGSPTAQYMLANAYYNGNGVRRDLEEGGRWLLKAAEQGHVPAQCDLGVMYSKGAGVEQSFEKSVRWLRAAAESGDSLARHSLGSIFAKGIRLKGTSFFNRDAFAYMKSTQDYAEAYKWFTLAAAAGQKRSARDRNVIRRWMRPYQIARAEKMVEEFRQAHGTARQPNRDAKGQTMATDAFEYGKNSWMARAQAPSARSTITRK
jgi:TPR repeat protein